MAFQSINNKAFILVFLFILSSCSAANLSRQREKPGWVKERPVSDEYYIGIGMANKHQDHYTRIAKNNALADMISEISVKISSNSILRQFEDNTEFREQFESFTRMSMKDELEGYELVDSYNGNDQYWVYYRLSIDKYNRIKRRKIEKAKSLAKDFFEKALEAQSNYDIHNAINYYVQSFGAVKPYLDEDISVFMLEKGRVNLGNAIYRNLQEIFSNIRVIPDKEVFHIRALARNNPNVKATVYYETKNNKKRITNLPFTFSFPELEIEKTETVQSNSSGEIICSIADMAPKGRQQKIQARLNTQSYFGKDSGGNLLKEMFRNEGILPGGYLNLKVEDVKAYLIAEETEFGESSDARPVTQLFREALSEGLFSFVPNKKKAEAIIKVSATTEPGKKMDQFDLHTAYLSCHVSITNAKTNEEVYSTGIQNIKGMKSGSFQLAAQDAQQKAKKQIHQQIIPELRKIEF